MTINTKYENPVVSPESTDNRRKPVQSATTGEWWPDTIACALDLGVKPQAVRFACRGVTGSCAGHVLRYVEDVEGVRTGMAEGLARANAKAEALSAEKAAVKAENESLRAELERLRAIEKEYNKRQKEEDERNAEIARLTKVRARHQNAYDRYMEHVNSSIRCMEEIDRKLEDLKKGRK